MDSDNATVMSGGGRVRSLQPPGRIVGKDLDQLLSFPVSAHVNANAAVASDCSEQLRTLQRRIAVPTIRRSGSEYLSSLLAGRPGSESQST